MYFSGRENTQVLNGKRKEEEKVIKFGVYVSVLAKDV